MFGIWDDSEDKRLRKIVLIYSISTTIQIIACSLFLCGVVVCLALSL